MKNVKEKNERFYQKWEVQRTKKWKFVFRYGCLYCGLPMAIIVSLLTFPDDIIAKVSLGLCNFLITGSIVGLVIYYNLEKSYLSWIALKNIHFYKTNYRNSTNELNDAQKKFYKSFEEKRKRKWKIVFLHGSVYWGLPVAILLILFDVNTNNIISWHSLFMIIVFMMAGIWTGTLSFTQMNNNYLGFYDETFIIEGIDKIKSGEIWSFENLRIKKENEESLIVNNDLYWFDDTEILPENLNESFKLLKEDFNRLRKNKEFKEYSKAMNVKLQIFDNSGSNIPLLEETI